MSIKIEVIIFIQQLKTNKMRTNNKEVKNKIQEYILSCIETDNGKEDVKSKLTYVLEAFQSEFVYKNNIKRYKTWGNVFIEWLNGCPSSINIEFYTKEILELMAGFGLPLPSNKDEIDGVNLYHRLLFMNFVDLCKKEKIDFYHYTTYTK